MTCWLPFQSDLDGHSRDYRSMALAEYHFVGESRHWAEDLSRSVLIKKACREWGTAQLLAALEWNDLLSFTELTWAYTSWWVQGFLLLCCRVSWVHPSSYTCSTSIECWTNHDHHQRKCYSFVSLPFVDWLPCKSLTDGLLCQCSWVTASSLLTFSAQSCYTVSVRANLSSLFLCK